MPCFALPCREVKPFVGTALILIAAILAVTMFFAMVGIFKICKGLNSEASATECLTCLQEMDFVVGPEARAGSEAEFVLSKQGFDFNKVL
jgi:hypothetical protein